MTFPPSNVHALNRLNVENRVHSIRKRAWRGLEKSNALLDVDIALQINPSGVYDVVYPRNKPVEIGELVQLVSAGAALPVRLRSEENPLIRLGKPLAQHYARQTSIERASDGLVGSGWVTAVVEAPGLDCTIPEWMRGEKVERTHIQLASHDTSVPGGGNLRIHVLWGGRRTTGDRTLIRALRIHILRLHSIYELLRFLASGASTRSGFPYSAVPGEKGFDNLQNTLLECARIVNKPDAIGGLPLPDVLNTAFFSRQFADRDLPQMFGQTLNAMRPKVIKAVNTLIEKEARRFENNVATFVTDTDRQKLNIQPNEQSAFESWVQNLAEAYKHAVEETEAWRLLWNDDGTHREEKICQVAADSMWRSSCETADVDMSREVDTGRGPVDFKFSHGWANRVLLEVKYIKSSKFYSGTEKQLPQYLKSERISFGIYLAIGFTDEDFKPHQRKRVQESCAKLSDDAGVRIIPVFVDARKSTKKSASTL
ncbi:hypothetical protein OUO20_05475 [Arthrobacter sp. FX8]|uniref:hypothetical protein n=1 Tax=Arthrobacter sp. FX8 TaxID=2997335 RepID=UPI00227B993B|nr:hypothetical protein [Arthrobacter sp. FX8]WAJ34386.1 hypothetical protein OUO20_05475 [Arthrobacter sp. FX8]